MSCKPLLLISLILLGFLNLTSSCSSDISIFTPGVLIIEIPNVENREDNERLVRDLTGLILLDGVLYSGYLMSYSVDQVLINKRGYYQGKLEGRSTSYYQSGALRDNRPYKNGKKHGEHKGWYENGQLKFHYFFEDGLSVGNHKVWYKNGSPFKDMNYKKGRPFGSQKVWRSDGKVRANYVIRENGRKYGLAGLKRCTKIDSDTKIIDPYTGKEKDISNVFE